MRIRSLQHTKCPCFGFRAAFSYMFFLKYWQLESLNFSFYLKKLWIVFMFQTKTRKSDGRESTGKSNSSLFSHLFFSLSYHSSESQVWILQIYWTPMCMSPGNAFRIFVLFMWWKNVSNCFKKNPISSLTSSQWF